jgi:hypothetical protein
MSRRQDNVPNTVMEAVDDRTAVYVLETRPCFEDLRQVAAQLAGVLVLAAAGSKSVAPDHPMIAMAAATLDAAESAIRCASPTPRASEHPRCLEQAADLLRDALAITRRRLDPEAVLKPLKAAYASLERASKTLPGFPLVAFEQGCCALHIT